MLIRHLILMTEGPPLGFVSTFVLIWCLGNLRSNIRFQGLAQWQSKESHATHCKTHLDIFLTELTIHLPKPPLVWCDNLSTVLLSANPIQHARTKHIELDLYFVREKVHRALPSTFQLMIKLLMFLLNLSPVLKSIPFKTNLRVHQPPTLSLKRGAVLAVHLLVIQQKKTKLQLVIFLGCSIAQPT